MSKYVPFEAEDTMQYIKYTSIASRVNIVLECVNFPIKMLELHFI